MAIVFADPLSALFKFQQTLGQSLHQRLARSSPGKRRRNLPHQSMSSAKATMSSSSPRCRDHAKSDLHIECQRSDHSYRGNQSAQRQ